MGLAGNGKLHGILGNIRLNDNGRGKRDGCSLLLCLLRLCSHTHTQEMFNKDKVEGVYVDQSDRQEECRLVLYLGLCAFPDKRE